MQGTHPRCSFCRRGLRGTPSFTAGTAARGSTCTQSTARSPPCCTKCMGCGETPRVGASLAAVPLLRGDPTGEHPPQGCCRAVPPQRPKPVETCARGTPFPCASCSPTASGVPPRGPLLPAGPLSGTNVLTRWLEDEQRQHSQGRGLGARPRSSRLQHGPPAQRLGAAGNASQPLHVPRSQLCLQARGSRARRHSCPRPAKPTRGWDAASAARESHSRGRCAAISSKHKPIASPAAGAGTQTRPLQRGRTRGEPSVGRHRHRADAARNGARPCKAGSRAAGSEAAGAARPKVTQAGREPCKCRLGTAPAASGLSRALRGDGGAASAASWVVEQGSPDHPGRSLALSAR